LGVDPGAAIPITFCKKPIYTTSMNKYAILLALVLPSCESGNRSESDAASIVVDQGLRSLLGVSGISANLKVPSGCSSYLVTTLEFEDGELVRRGAMVAGGVDARQDSNVPVQLTWGIVEGAGRSSLVIPGVQSRGEDEFWIRTTSTSNYDGQSAPEFEGFQVLGLGQSQETRAEVDKNTGYGYDFDHALRTKRYISILVGRCFKTQEERDEFSESYFKKRIKRQNKAEMATPRKPSD
jgi:hypothetical protein